MAIIKAGLLLLHLLPFAVSPAIGCGKLKKYDRAWKKHARLAAHSASLVINAIALYFFYIVFEVTRPISKMAALTGIGKAVLSYQDVARMASAAFLGCVFSLFLGAGIYRLLYKKSLKLWLRKRGAVLAGISILLIPTALLWLCGHNGPKKLEICEVCRRLDVEEYRGGDNSEFKIQNTKLMYPAMQDDLDLLRAGLNANLPEAEDDISFISVRNNGKLACELGSIWISDNPEALKECRFKEQALGPGECAFLILEEDSFLAIKKAGGTVVYLSDNFGNVLDEVTVPALKKNEAYFQNSELGSASGTDLNSDGLIVLLVAEEDKEEAVAVAAPVFSHEAGFYDDAFTLTITAEPGCTILYTLDGSEPARNSELKYTATQDSLDHVICTGTNTAEIYVYDRSGEENVFRNISNVTFDYLRTWKQPEAVDKAFVVRAVSVDAEGNCSETITRTFFVGLEQYKSGLVFSLVSDPEGIFGEDGFYVTGKEYDEWYNSNQTAIQSGEIILDNGIWYIKKSEFETQEEWEISRRTAGAPDANFLKKGDEWEREAELEVFENSGLLLEQPVGIRTQGNSSRRSTLKRFAIYSRNRYSGNSLFEENLVNDNAQHMLLFRMGDLYALSHTLGKGRGIATQDSTVATLFLNGEYWYTTYLYEKYNEKNLAEKYSLSAENIALVKNGAQSEKTEDGVHPYSLIYGYIRNNDLSIDENYDEFNTIIDIQSFIDSSCLNTILENLDYQEEWNNMIWHTVVPENKAFGDTRWRWALYDMDLNWKDLAEEFPLTESYAINPYETYGINQRTIVTEWPIFAALRANERFTQQYVLTFMDLINSTFQWENVSEKLDELEITDEAVRTFFEKRPLYVVLYMAREFELTGTQCTVTLESNGGAESITLNTITPELKGNGEWRREKGELLDPASQDDLNNSSEADTAGYGLTDTGRLTWEGKYFSDYPVTVTANGQGFDHWEIESGGTKTTSTQRTLEVPVVYPGITIRAVFA